MNFNNLSIKRKLLIAFVSLFIFSAIIAAYSYYAITSVILNNPAKALIDEVNVIFLNAKQSEKDFSTYGTTEEDFLVTGESDYIKEHSTHIERVLKLKRQIAKLNFAKDLKVQRELKEIEGKVILYNKQFHDLVDLYKTRGFKDYGLEGEMRAAIHGIEKSGINFDRALMLMLRRHEKDFFLRKDPKYLAKFKAGFADFQTSIMMDETQYDLFDPLQSYMSLFEKIVQVEAAIGFDESHGIRGEIGKTTTSINESFNNFDLRVQKSIKKSVNNTIYILIALIAAQILLSILLTIYFIRVIVKPIVRIQDKSNILARGQIPSIEQVTGKDEIAQTQNAFNQLILNTKKAIKFAQNIGEGNFNYKFKTGKKDRMGNALLDMRERLKKIQDQQELAKLEEEKQAWATQGVAFFGELLRKSNNDLQEMAYEVLKEIADYIDAQQGAIYIIEAQKGNMPDKLNLSAVFSGDRRKYNEKQLDVGEGVIGQTALENKKVIFKDIPTSYKNIDSGMASFDPAMILILPLTVNGEVQGVLELSSIKEIESHVIDFLEKLSESIASTISTVRVNETTKKLLENSQKMSEELRAQEEELRQNQEEMQATQEELNRQLREAQSSKDELMARIFELENKQKG